MQRAVGVRAPHPPECFDRGQDFGYPTPFVDSASPSSIRIPVTRPGQSVTSGAGARRLHRPPPAGWRLAALMSYWAITGRAAVSAAGSPLLARASCPTVTDPDDAAAALYGRLAGVGS